MNENEKHHEADVYECNESAPGTLYLCATPIGNLEDMTYRAVRVLGEVDLIAAEDTRHTRQLLSHFDIHTPLTSYHEHNKRTKGAVLIERLLRGENIACVSDAGLPGIADPGSDLARLAIEAGVRVVPLPGANAALSALIASGLDTTWFTFVGFLPRTKAKCAARLASVATRTETLLFYEAPHHLKGTLAALLEFLGDRPAVLARELTKRYEEFRRGTLSSLLATCETAELRGEFVIAVAGADAIAQETATGDDAPPDFAALVADRVATGASKKEAMRDVAKAFGVSRRDVYQAVLVAEDGVTGEA